MTVQNLPILGKTCTRIEVIEDHEIRFTCTDGTQYSMHHEQECCENVRIEDICGDLDDLIGVPLTVAEASSTQHESHGWQATWESATWTFYRFAARGYVTIRWVGESNGYYSEEVSFDEVET